ncbi:hypothetical protein HA052_16550 [Chromobacterium haemolyticum]|uniref:Lipoprotein n=1 Tax=Chromobacterium fluminis TaxID=3044269 RepID=A0ABX0L7N7_9NEIS|nr:hypothetical protein [Chromobacterium haemolyticum]NHR06800.1 hypothetical protein [Chromobacterium haemolyticum]
MYANGLLSLLGGMIIGAASLTTCASSLYQGIITTRNTEAGKVCFSVDNYRSANKSVAIPAKGLVLTSITVYTETANGAQAIWKINAASRNEVELYKVKSGECLIYGEVIAGKYTVSQAPKPLPASTPLEVVATYWYPAEFNNILSMGGKFCSMENGIIDASEDGSCPGQSAPKKRAKSL